MKIDIFIKSYFKDFWLLYIALKTITKYVTGYNNIILLIPEHEKDLFDTRNMPERTLIHYVKEYGQGWLFQQWCKINAHTYSDADFIMFSDSDCFFDHDLDLQTLIPDNRPEILYTYWEKIPEALIWRQPTEAIMNESVPWEGMRRNNLIYHRDTLINLNKFQPNLQYIIMGAERFSEFNLMSSYAFRYEKEKYSFVNTDEWTYVPPHAIQVWSWADKNGSDLHKKEYERIMETIKKVLP